MSYAVFTVCYGLPMSTGQDRSTALRKLVERQPAGVHTIYNGSTSNTPAAFGVVLGVFNDCCHHVELTDLQLAPTSQNLVDFTALFEALTQRDKDALKDLGPPRVFFLAGTS